jgi:periplasmic copper chaperone A
MKLFAVALLCAMFLMTAIGQSSLEVKDPWVRATAANQKATGAFMRISAASGGRLVEVRSPVAGVAEVHEMTMDGNVMKMRAVSGIDLPAGKAVELKPGGYHVMLMDLKQPLKEGDSVPITLIVELAGGKREAVDLKVPVRPLGTATADPHKH